MSPALLENGIAHCSKDAGIVVYQNNIRRQFDIILQSTVDNSISKCCIQLPRSSNVVPFQNCMVIYRYVSSVNEIELTGFRASRFRSLTQLYYLLVY